jgi:hypothetical protein
MSIEGLVNSPSTEAAYSLVTDSTPSITLGLGRFVGIVVPLVGIILLYKDRK